MAREPGLLASFAAPGRAAEAVRALHEAGYRDVRVATPAPFPELVAAIGKPVSHVGWFTLPGALFGLLCGVALTAGTSLAWPLVTGGKPIVSWPPFVIVIFEVTVLIGSLVNLVAVAVGVWHGGRAGSFPAHDRFNGELVGLFVPGGGPEVERILQGAGAAEVSRVD